MIVFLVGTNSTYWNLGVVSVIGRWEKNKRNVHIGHCFDAELHDDAVLPTNPTHKPATRDNLRVCIVRYIISFPT